MAAPFLRNLKVKLAIFSKDSTARIGIVCGNGIIDVGRHVTNAPSNMIELMSRWSQLRAQFEMSAGKAADFELAAVKLHAPIPKPGKIMAIGLNYSDHCAETGQEIPRNQVWFSKAPTAVTGPYDPIELPAASEALDHECEMVAVIGTRGRNVPRDRAREIVFGYCVGNDVSVRDWQTRTTQWVVGKSFDTHAPIGPWITTADEIDPHQLDIRCLVDGIERQKSNTRYLVFDTFAQVEHLTQAMTLEPGDLLFTGTCGGVGLAAKPPRWLKSGQRVRVEIAQLGAIENGVAPGPTAPQIGGTQVI
jgi:2-keto-4-pentenoate hydratase/2-oxohepta-3-ene-1,7-dioic acid hydratase in catechol pathway